MNKLTFWIAGLLVAVLGWIFSITYAKLCAIQTQLVMVQLELAKVQATLVDRSEVEKICEDILLKHGIK